MRRHGQDLMRISGRRLGRRRIGRSYYLSPAIGIATTAPASAGRDLFQFPFAFACGACVFVLLGRTNADDPSAPRRLISWAACAGSRTCVARAVRLLVAKKGPTTTFPRKRDPRNADLLAVNVPAVFVDFDLFVGHAAYVAAAAARAAAGTIRIAAHTAASHVASLGSTG